MNDSELGEIETRLLRIYIPGIDKAHCRALRKLCREKCVNIFSADLQEQCKRLLASIIRHRETHYDEIIKMVGKKRARFYVQHIVDDALKKY